MYARACVYIYILWDYVKQQSTLIIMKLQYFHSILYQARMNLELCKF